MAKEQQTNGKGDEETTEEVLTPVGPGAADETVTEEPSGAKAQQAITDEHEDETEGEDDRRAGHVDDEDEANLSLEQQAKRERRRAERKQRKEQYRRDQVELNFLRRRNEDLERRFSGMERRVAGTEQMTLDARIAQVDEQIRLAEQIHGQAVEKGSGNDATEALRIKDELLEGKRQLMDAKRRMAATRGGQANGDAFRPDPEIANRARQWISENSWFDPQLRDPDSRVAKTIEDGLYAERRLDPRSDAYWEEYNRRLAKYLPDKIKARRDDERHDDLDDEEDEPEERAATPPEKPAKRKPGGPTFRTGGRERSLKKGEVYVSAERRKAMEDMGVWEDETLRNRYLRAYSRYDREHSTKQ